MIPIRDILPTQRFPAVTVALIAANSAVFLYELALGQGVGRFVAAYAMTPYEITHGVDLVAVGPGAGHAPGPPLIYLTLFSSMFMHGGFMHFAGNMLYLWIFGNNVEDALGRRRFTAFYFLCGLAAHAAQIATGKESIVPTLGASGAISGVLAAYLLLFPRARVLTLIFLGYFIRIVELPAFFILAFWIIVQSLQGLASIGAGGASSGGVAWFEHIGGFAAGMILLKIFLPRYRRLRAR